MDDNWSSHFLSSSLVRSLVLVVDSAKVAHDDLMMMMMTMMMIIIIIIIMTVMAM